MAVFLTDKDTLGRERKELKLEDFKIPSFDFMKNGIECSITIDNDKAFQALYCSNIKDKVTRATFKSGKVIEVKTISNKNFISRIKFRIVIKRLLRDLKGIKQNLRRKLIGE